MRSIKFDQIGQRTAGVARPAQLAAGSLSFRAEDATRAASEPGVSAAPVKTEGAGVAAVSPPVTSQGQGRG
jgi:hypothetical protein